MTSTALVLLSGGLDSTVALWWALKQGYPEIESLTFRYGSKEEVSSLRCASSIAKRAGIANHHVMELEALRRIASGHSSLVGRSGNIPPGLDGPDMAATKAVWVPARNLVMVSMAASLSETLRGDVDIVVGYDEEEARTFPDNSKRFVGNINLALEDAVMQKRVRVVAPLIDLGKRDIVALSQQLGAPVEMSCSCYQPKGFSGDRPIHCGVCQSCILRNRGFLSAGVEDPTIYEVEPS